MSDPRFFRRAGPFPLAALAAAVDGEIGAGDPDLVIEDVAAMEDARPGTVTFLDNVRYLGKLKESHASACIVEPKNKHRAPAGMALVLVARPHLAFAKIAHLFYPPPIAQAGRHPTAAIHPTAQVAASAEICAYAVIEAGAAVGEGCRIGPHSVVGPGVSVGARTFVGPHVSLEYCLIGEDCQIHAGVRIGTRGFGFALADGAFLDVPQVGRVVVGRGVEVGANSTIDRGSASDTVVGDGCKIDNLVQLGHNVRLGRLCVIVAQSGVAGSARLEDGVMLGAQGGIAGHLQIGAGAKVAAQAGVMRDVSAGDTVGGSPAMALRDYFRLVAWWQSELKRNKGRCE